MRYLLFPDEERTFLRHLEETFALVPLTPSGARAADGIPGPGRDEGPSGPPNRELVFWARDAGPLVRLSDPPTPHDAAGRVMRQVNRDAGVPDDAVDRERTPWLIVASHFPLYLAHNQPCKPPRSRCHLGCILLKCQRYRC